MARNTFHLLASALAALVLTLSPVAQAQTKPIVIGQT